MITKKEFEDEYNLEFEIIPENNGLGDAIVSWVKIDHKLFCIGTRFDVIDKGTELLISGNNIDPSVALGIFIKHFKVDETRIEKP